MPEQTSRRAKVALATLVAGYFAHGSRRRRSDLAAHGPAAERRSSSDLGAFPCDSADLANVGRRGLTAVAWVLLVVVVAAFAVVVLEAWSKRVRLVAVLTAASCSLLIAVVGPLFLSRDVYTYAAYGRIEALYGANPYLTTLSAFPHDRFVAVTSVQWLPYPLALRSAVHTGKRRARPRVGEFGRWNDPRVQGARRGLDRGSHGSRDTRRTRDPS